MATLITKMRVKGKIRTSRVTPELHCHICNRPMGDIAFNKNAHIRCLNKNIEAENRWHEIVMISRKEAKQ